MRGLVVTNGYLQPQLFGGMREVVNDLRKARPGNLSLLFTRWRSYDTILKWLDALRPEFVDFLGYSYGASTNAFVAQAISTRIRHFVSIDGVWRPEIQKIEVDSIQENHVIDLTGTSVEHLHTVRQERGILTGHTYKIDPGCSHDTDIVIPDEDIGALAHLRIQKLETVRALCLELFV